MAKLRSGDLDLRTLERQFRETERKDDLGSTLRTQVNMETRDSIIALCCGHENFWLAPLRFGHLSVRTHELTARQTIAIDKLAADNKQLKAELEIVQRDLDHSQQSSAAIRTLQAKIEYYEVSVLAGLETNVFLLAALSRLYSCFSLSLSSPLELTFAQV